MADTQTLQDGTVVPTDQFETACGIVMGAVSLKSVSRHTDVVDAIAKALFAERQKTRQDCLMEFGTDEAMGYHVGV